MDWFTADWHVGHRNVLKLCNRPFADLDEMHSALINNWNTRVKKTDTVYHLGDFCLGGHKKALEIIEQLNGKIYFVPGGHDEWLRKNRPTEGLYTVLPPLYSLEYKDRGKNGYPLVVVLCHYSLRVWDRSHYGSLHLYGCPIYDLSPAMIICQWLIRLLNRHGYPSINLYGHSHGNLPPLPRSMDVGVDCHNYAPISLDEVLAKLLPPVI